jgi:hypothetical protein
MKMINLGRKCDTCEMTISPSSKKASKVYYPTLYISGVKGLDLGVGPIEFHAKGKVVSVSERETMKDGKPSEDYSVEIEVQEMVPMGMSEMEDSASGLEDAMDSIAAKKSKSLMAESEMDDETEDEDMAEEENY